MCVYVFFCWSCLKLGIHLLFKLSCRNACAAYPNRHKTYVPTALLSLIWESLPAKLQETGSTYMVVGFAGSSTIRDKTSHLLLWELLEAFDSFHRGATQSTLTALLLLTTTKLFSASQVLTETNHLLCLLETILDCFPDWTTFVLFLLGKCKVQFRVCPLLRSDDDRYEAKRSSCLFFLWMFWCSAKLYAIYIFWIFADTFGSGTD